MAQKEREVCEFVVRKDDFFERFDIDERFRERGEAVSLKVKGLKLL